MHAIRDGDERWLCRLTPLCLDTLQRLFEWIDSDDPRVRERLRPQTFTDPEEEAAWRRLMDADLAHLVQSRRQLIEDDLARLEVDGDGLYKVPVPDTHVAAWLSALNGARLALFILAGLQPGDLDRDLDDLDDRGQQLALLRIYVMAYLQDLLM